MERAIALSERSLALPRVAAVILGAAFVAAAAQVSLPLPGTPVPMTLQPLAVLLVGGLLGARLGAMSMVLYLALGIAGLPVFTPTVPLLGIARLLGPTGGYLLAYPVAAFAVGALVREGRDWRRVRSEEHTSELQSHLNLVCRLLLEKKKKQQLHMLKKPHNHTTAGY